jgi:hypothetical protein
MTMRQKAMSEVRRYWTEAAPLRKAIRSEAIKLFGEVGVGLVLGFVGILALLALGWLWENVEAIRYLVYGGIALIVLVYLAALWPLWLAIAALVYIMKNC